MNRFAPSMKESNLWRATARPCQFHPRSNTGRVDLAVIGGGYTGCAAALGAARSGADVALFEAHEIGGGGSGRNVGLVNAGLWLPPDTVEDILGAAAGRRLNAALAEAPAKVWSLVDAHDIDCDATREGTLHLGHSSAGLADLRARYAQQKARDAPVQLLDARETARRVGSDRFHGALLDRRAGTIQPLSYCHGLARAAQEAGAAIHENTPVSSVRFEGGVWRLRTGSGEEVRAERLLLATNAYHSQAHGLVPPVSTPVHYFQIATAPLPESLLETILPGGEGCWDTATVMSSLRRDAAGRLLIGGVGESSLLHGKIHRNWARRKLRALFPQLETPEIAYCWHGRIAMTSDHVPKILRLGERALSIFGYSGRGIGPGTVFGATAADALLTSDESVLPLDPIDSYSEKLTRIKRACYEIGATAFHALPIRTGRFL